MRYSMSSGVYHYCHLATGMATTSGIQHTFNVHFSVFTDILCEKMCLIILSEFILAFFHDNFFVIDNTGVIKKRFYHIFILLLEP